MRPDRGSCGYLCVFADAAWLRRQSCEDPGVDNGSCATIDRIAVTLDPFETPLGWTGSGKCNGVPR